MLDESGPNVSFVMVAPLFTATTLSPRAGVTAAAR